MRIGVYLRLFGRPGGTEQPPGWSSLRAAAVAAEGAGFDRVVFEDVLLHAEDDGDQGVWDPTVVAAAIAASTSRIGLAHAVVNNPYHHPALVARAAATLDEVSGGRYSLGIGAGDTPADYERFGIPSHRRYSRLAESIAVIASLLRTGQAAIDGEFVQVPAGTLVLRGPRPAGPPIIIAAGKPRMLRLAAEQADEWNWWSTRPDAPEQERELVDAFDRACDEAGRDPDTVSRSIDLFSISPPGLDGSSDVGADELAARILGWQQLGFGEVRVNLATTGDTPVVEAIEAMAGVVDLVHRD
jgi:alkanesulfonate monooxygenase SsuD/methylene tetrahydromethanopterin reductase-like flavin-dependent oxidoreductase (luciferase family)